jgi:hypothetical protein
MGTAKGSSSIAGSRSLLKIIPMAWLARGAALIMLVLAGFSIVTAVSLPSFRGPPACQPGHARAGPGTLGSETPAEVVTGTE